MKLYLLAKYYNYEGADIEDIMIFASEDLRSDYIANNPCTGQYWHWDISDTELITKNISNGPYTKTN
jgi:hypothetical protein